MISIKVPTVGESITEVTLLKWTKAEGAWVDRDEVIAELESEKATFEVNAEQAGVLFRKANEGDSILIGAILADIDETAAKPVAAAQTISVDEYADNMALSLAQLETVTLMLTVLDQTDGGPAPTE